MEITSQNTWIETVLQLAKLRHESEARYDEAIENLVDIVREKAIADKPFAYLRFEAAEDCHMTLAEIAKAFTQQDYPEMVKELVVDPAEMMTKILTAIDEDPTMSSEAAKQPGITDKLIDAGLRCLVIEIGQNPETCIEPEASSDGPEGKRPAP